MWHVFNREKGDNIWQGIKKKYPKSIEFFENTAQGLLWLALAVIGFAVVIGFFFLRFGRGYLRQYFDI
jgi:hypothetical protein